MPNAWEGHYQGGPIGYGQREFEIAPCQTDSRLVVGSHLFRYRDLAFNPSLPGGAKDEDTFLVTADGIELITTTHDWPAADDAESAAAGHLAIRRCGMNQSAIEVGTRDC